MALRDELRKACSGSGDCIALEHWHGCGRDWDGSDCDEPNEHPKGEK